jgi:predicted short-subunit dehydrogenase-like oxidoreductase (DUF2520 family)
MTVQTTVQRWAVVGGGRVGTALQHALADLDGPFGRGFDGHGHDVVVLAVPDRAIADAAAAVVPGRLVGHCSGATGLDVLAPHECFGMHPLMTFSGSRRSFAGASAAIAGSTPRALGIARRLAERLGMQPFELADADRAAYHAAASIASNFLVTIEDAAELLLGTAGLERKILLPLVRATLDNWEREGAAALTGPVARGDEATVERQRRAITERAPELVDMFDALVARTREVGQAQPRS